MMATLMAEMTNMGTTQTSSEEVKDLPELAIRSPGSISSLGSMVSMFSMMSVATLNLSRILENITLTSRICLELVLPF